MPSKEIHLPNPEAEKPKEVINPIKKLFIANRGEIAVRAMKACVKMNISAVVAYADQDIDSLATRTAKNKSWELTRVENYMDQDGILKEALASKCDAIFLGYGFLSEKPEFVEKCEKAGLKVLAPPSEKMGLIADKIIAKETARELGIRVLDGTGNLPTLEDAKRKSLELKFPVMLKIPDMGGGKGNLAARNSEELEDAYNKLKRRKPNCEIFMEHYVENAVHVEVQIAADKYGRVISLGERDCTMQRQHQKVIEESPSPHIKNRMRKRMQKAAIKFAKKIGYQGIGTWEFIVDKDKKTWYFMEVNQRIQVEHGVTEKQTGVDIVELMIKIAEGRRLPFSQKDIKPQGHTIEVRLCAEKLCETKNGEKFIAPCPGRISIINFPKDENVRVDAGAEDGDEMSSDFDSLIAKIIIHGKDRKEARTKLISYLRQITVEGINCNKEFLIDLLESEEFCNGEATTSSIENILKRGKKELDKAKEGLKEELKKARRKLRKKAIIFRRKRRGKRNGRKH